MPEIPDSTRLEHETTHFALLEAAKAASGRSGVAEFFPAPEENSHESNTPQLRPERSRPRSARNR